MTTLVEWTTNMSGDHYEGNTFHSWSLDQPPPFTTESAQMDNRLRVSSAYVSYTHTPSNYTLLWRLEELEQVSEAERWPSSDWPSPQAFADARAFIYTLPASVPILLPYLGLADDGEINFLWKQDGIHIDLGFYGTGTFSYFARGKDNKEIYGDDVPAATGLPEPLIAFLRC